MVDAETPELKRIIKSANPLKSKVIRYTRRRNKQFVPPPPHAKRAWCVMSSWLEPTRCDTKCKFRFELSFKCSHSG